MITLDFSKIRIHDGSQQNGFEELICQLAHLEPPENSDYFVRKDGAGGDAGVECYWKLSDGSEIAWQAKYFIDPLKDTQWREINDSVNSFLNKHPDVKKYYVCLPRDWNDSRKKGRGGKTVKSSWDKWLEWKQKWEEKAKNLGRQVEFHYWCKHEISQRLQKSDSKYSGRAEYWFNSPILTHDAFSNIAEGSKEILGERYDEENNINLPISKYFDSIALTKKWQEELTLKLDEWLIHCRKSNRIIINEATSSANELTLSVTDELKQIGEIFNQILIPVNSILKNTDIYVDTVIQLSDLINELKLKFIQNMGQRFYQELLNRINSFQDSISAITNFLNSQLYSVSKLRYGIVTGDAGIGKSHLLCDRVLERINSKLPTIFLLGQHYSGGDPINWIKGSINLSNIENDIFLSALDSAGQASKTNVLIVIDAINEGGSNLDWKHNLEKFISEILRYSHISLILSCRNSFINYLIPKEIQNRTGVLISHEGFKGNEIKAAVKYLSKFGLTMPNVPILAPEFSNPLFLKTCCKSLNEKGIKVFPKDLKGLVKLFEFYVDNIEQKVAELKNYNYQEGLVKNALLEFANKLYPDYIYGMETSAARKFFESKDPNINSGESLLNILIHESVLSEDISFITGQNKPVIRFTYERYSDYFIAESICSGLTKDLIGDACDQDGALFELFSDEEHYHDNILLAVSIIVAELFHIELVDYIPKEKLNYQLFDNIFTDTLIWRTPGTITEKTLDWLNSVKNIGFRSTATDVILNFAVDPDHPWNAYFINAKLQEMSLPERDAFWTTHININDYYEEDDQNTSIVRKLIDWGHLNNFEHVNEIQIKLYCMVMIWFTSSSNRIIRDQSTKSTTQALITQPQITKFLLNEFNDIDDLYVKERLYAIAYGVVTNIDNEEIIKQIADQTYINIFSKENILPHVLLRDYASGIVEFAFQLGLLNEKYDPKNHRPPFKSIWPLDDPKSDLFESEEIGSSSIKSSIMGFIGDFGNYSMGRIHDWSTSPIGTTPLTKLDLLNNFVKTIPNKARSIINSYIDHRIVKENSFEHSDDKLKQIGTLDIDSWTKKVKEQQAEDVDKWLEKNKNGTEELYHNRFSFKGLKEKLENIISSDQLEELRWIHGLANLNSVANTSRKKAQRWVCKRAFDLGWSKELFEKYERNHCLSNSNRSTNKIERIGKKYQWIAFHEYLAHLSDNCSYIDPGYDDVGYSIFHGAWQIHERNIDPTLLVRKTNDIGWNSFNPCWWLKYEHQFKGENLEDKDAWLWDTENLPSFESVVSVVNPTSEAQFLMLRGFAKLRKDSEHEDIPYQEMWFRVNSCIIKNDNYSKLKNIIGKDNLQNPDILAPDSSGHQCFLKEFPWHPSYNDHRIWKNELSFKLKHKVQHLIPTSIYEWEKGSSDYSIDESISIYMPSKVMVNSLGLKHDLSNLGNWVNKERGLVFQDPSVAEQGPPTALINKQIIWDWLCCNNYKLVWLIGGEKQMFTDKSHKFYGRLVFNKLLCLTKDGFEVESWYTRSPAKPSDP